MKIKLVTSTDPGQFDRDLNMELDRLGKGVISVQFSTAMTNQPDNDWDTVYSAIVVYK